MTTEETLERSFVRTYPVVEWSAEEDAFSGEARIINEYRLLVEVNGQVCMTIVCTPGDDRDLVAGRLFTEGFVDKASDIESIVFSHLGNGKTLAVVTLDNHEALLPDAQITDVPTVGDSCQVTRRFSSRKDRATFLTKGEYGHWRIRDVFMLNDLFSMDSPLHSYTGGAHSCYILCPDGSIHISEDIGRHNAVDKAIGWALLNNVDMASSVAFISGRVPTDMMTKAVRAKFNAFITRKLPTREAIDMARMYRVTLLGDVKRGRVKVFSGLQPID